MDLTVKKVRVDAGRKPTPTYGLIDSQNAKTTLASREILNKAFKDIPHKCWTCKNSWDNNNGIACCLLHYESGSIYCKSWEWRGFNIQ